MRRGGRGLCEDASFTPGSSSQQKRELMDFGFTTGDRPSTDRTRIRIAILLLVLCLLPGCSPGKPLAGTYRSTLAADGATRDELKLEADGKGVWRVGKETVSFKWESRGSEIWLHTRTGGVVRGTVTPDQSIDIQVPGVGPFHFERAL